MVEGEEELFLVFMAGARIAPGKVKGKRETSMNINHRGAMTRSIRHIRPQINIHTPHCDGLHNAPLHHNH